MIIVTIEARSKSTRLPNKILRKLGDKSILELIYSKAQRIQNIDKVIIATTNKKYDDSLVNYLIKNSMNFYRGDEDDVWGRLINCGEENNADTIIKLTGDNPLIDINIINEALNKFLDFKDIDILCISEKRSLPIGFDFEIIKFKSLKISYLKERTEYDKEHATTFLKKYFKRYDFKPSIKIPKDLISSLEFTIDTLEDYNFVKKFTIDLKKPVEEINIFDILNLYKNKSVSHIGDRKWEKGY